MIGRYYKFSVGPAARYVFVGSKADNAQEALYVGFGGTPEAAHGYATQTPIVAARGHGPAVSWAAEHFDELAGYENGKALWGECEVVGLHAPRLSFGASK